MEVCAAVTMVNKCTTMGLCIPTVRMSMRLDRKAQNSEAMVAYRIVFDSGLVLENVVYRLGEEANEGVPLRRGNKYAAQLES